eukprot:10987550-Prorocentrum_lima.AAC.1
MVRKVTECPSSLVSRIAAEVQVMRVRSCSPPMPPSSMNVPGGTLMASAIMWSNRDACAQLGSKANLLSLIHI